MPPKRTSNRRPSFVQVRYTIGEGRVCDGDGNNGPNDADRCSSCQLMRDMPLRHHRAGREKQPSATRGGGIRTHFKSCHYSRPRARVAFILGFMCTWEIPAIPSRRDLCLHIACARVLSRCNRATRRLLRKRLRSRTHGDAVQTDLKPAAIVCASGIHHWRGYSL